MIEGAGGSDHGTIRRFAWERPDLFAALMDKLVRSTSAYLIAQVEAGADTLQLFDTWAGSVPSPLFEAAVIEPTRAIVAAVKARHPKVPVIGFPRGAAARLPEYVAKTGVDAVGIDYTADLPAVAATLPRHIAVQGNLDPMLLVAGGARMIAETEKLLAAMKGRPYVFNLGHGIVPPTPPDHVAELMARVRAG
jgi:uroporphyrinogen decarboxylase